MSSLLYRSLCVPCLLFVIGCGSTSTAKPDGGDDPAADAASLDAAIDAAIADARPPMIDAVPVVYDAGPPDAMPMMPAYTTLSQTGLYANIANKTIAAGIREFAPRYELWSDGAVKRRWIYLPPGAQIDTTDMDEWRFPVGTKVWKEFANDDSGFIRLETRLIERWGPNVSDWWMGAFVWNPAESDATYLADGATDVRGTQHDVPAANQCMSCHAGAADRLLGFSAVQLSYNAAVNLTSLASDGVLSDPPPGGTTYPVPGNTTESDALGYLHANCGHCHSQEQNLACYATTGLDLRVRTTDTSVTTTGAYVTAVDQPLTLFMGGGLTHRIVSGSPSSSGVRFRMNARGNAAQMPPQFTEVVDTAGIAIIDAWINAL